MSNYVCEIASPEDRGKKAVLNRRDDGKTLISVYTWVRQDRYSAEYHELGIDDAGRWQFAEHHSAMTTSPDAAVTVAQRLLRGHALAVGQG